MANSNSKDVKGLQKKTQTPKHDNSVEGNQPRANLAEAIRARFAPLGDVELELPPREPMREPPDFE